MIDFTKVNEIYLLDNVLSQTHTWLREAGRLQNESFILWAGHFKTLSSFVVTTAIFPEQKAFRTNSGVGVYVSGDELYKINKWLYNNDKTLISQVHSHPSVAYHSDTDDNFPLVTAIGQFSIVVPYFANAPLRNLLGCAVYRLDYNNHWSELNKQQINSIFKEVK